MKHQGRIDEARSYASDVGVLGLLEGLTRLRGLILLPVIGRVLGTGAYGVWTQSLVAVILGSSIVDMQLHVALVRFVSGTRDREEQLAYFVPLLLLVVGLSGPIVAVTAVAPEFIAQHLLGDVNYADVAAWLGLWTGLAAVSTMGLHMLRGLQRLKLYGVLNTTHAFVQLVLVAAVVLTWQDLLVAVLAVIAFEFVFAVSVLSLALRRIGLAWPGLKRLRPSLSFSLPLVPSFYSGTVLLYADRVVLASTLGAEAVGIYAAAYSVARVVREIFKPISTALLPVVSRVWDRGDQAQGRWLLSNTVHYYLLLALPALAGVTVLGPRILGLLAPQAVSEQAVWIIALLGVGFMLSSLRAVFEVLLQLLKATRVLAFTRGTAAILYLLLVILAVPRWGLLGGAGATAVGYGLDIGLTWAFAWRRDRFTLPWSATARATVATASMLLIVLLLSTVPGPAGLALSIVAGLAAYGVLMLLIGGLGRRELKFLLSAVGRGDADAATPDV